MTLFIQRDTGTAGTGSVFPDRAGAHLLIISNMDTGYGETTFSPSLTQVTYARTTSGPCPTRLDTLVNTDFPATAGAIDILVLATDTGFTLNDGSTLGANGLTFSPNQTFMGINFNPGNSALVVYDTTQDNGAGLCVKGQASGNYDLQTPNPVILYHELSHAFRICTAATLSLTASGCTASPEENAAEVDENDMRDQLALPHRDVTDHCGNPGCHSTCCIVASIACGSAYSRQVNELRQIRDRLLRKSEVGFDFFDHLHRDYYAFSPQVCQLMGRDGDLRTFVAAYFVEPLVTTLRSVYAYTVEGAAAETVGAGFIAGLDAIPSVAEITSEDIDALREVVRGGSDSAVRPAAERSASAGDLGAVLRETALGSDFVRWALLDLIEIFLDALAAFRSGSDAAAVGAVIARDVDDWGPRMPVTNVWRGLSMHAMTEELSFLRRALLPTAAARASFARRLTDTFDDDAGRRLQNALRGSDFLGDTGTEVSS